MFKIYFASVQWGSWITGIVSMATTIYSENPVLIIGATFLSMIFVIILSTGSQAAAVEMASAAKATNRLADVLRDDRHEIESRQKALADFQRWQDQHTIVYVGICELKASPSGSSYKFSQNLTMMKARLSDVLDYIKKEGFLWFSYNQSIDQKEISVTKEGVRLSPAWGAMYLSNNSGIIIGMTPEEVLHFKPRQELLNDWGKVFAFGRWRVDQDGKGRVRIHDEVSEIKEPVVEAPLVDPYDPTVKGRGSLKHGVTLEPSVTLPAVEEDVKVAFVH